MLRLLKNFTDIGVYDHTPRPEDTSVAADLNRIGHYRNKSAHMNERYLSVESFNLIWTDLTEVTLCLYQLLSKLFYICSFLSVFLFLNI